MLVSDTTAWSDTWMLKQVQHDGGAAVGIETGPGVVLTGLIGGVIFGTAGYFGADWVADHIDEN